MKPRLIPTLAAAAAITFGACLPAANAVGTGESRRAGTVVSENDCFEVLVVRSVVTAQVAELVPDRYALPTTDTMTLFIYNYTCRSVTVDGHPNVGEDKTTSVTVGAVQVTSIDGQTPTEFSAYVLWFGTSNPVQFAKLQQSGWPVSFQPRTKSTIPAAPAPGDVTTVHFAFRGAGLDYDLTSLVVEPVVHPDDGYISFWADTPAGQQLRLLIHNVASSDDARTSSTTAQLSGIGVLQPLLTDPRFNTIPQPGNTARSSYGRGSWQSQLLLGGASSLNESSRI